MEPLGLADSSRRQVLVVIILIALAIAIGPAIVGLQLGARELAIFILVVCGSVLAVAPNQRVLKMGFFLWIITFGFGWRTIHVTRYLNIHPSEALVVLLAVSILVNRILTRTPLDLALPVFVPPLLGFAALGIFTAWLQGRPADLILEESKIFFAIVPTFYVVKCIVTTAKDWKRAALLCVLVATYVSCLGMLDFFAPDLSARLAGIEPGATVYVDDFVGFGRAGFIFYGHFAAGFLIFTFFGWTLAYAMPFQRRSRWQLVGLGMLAVQLIGIYLSGFRGLWYSLAVFLVSYALVRRRGWIVIGVGIAGLPLLPVEFMQRLLSLFDIRYADSSQFARLDRATQAFNLMTSSPIMGLGWGGSGYVHSDLIQIGANLGVPALATFIAWILSQLWQFFQLSKRSDWMGEQASILFAALCGLSFVFAGEGLIVWAQFMVPIWFLFAMGYKLVDLAEKEEGNA